MKMDSLHERKRYHNRTVRFRPLHHPLGFCGSRQRLIAKEAAKKGTLRKAIKLEVCTGSRIGRTVAVKSPDAIRSRGKCASRGTIGMVRGACRRLWVKVHAHKLKLEAIKMRDVWDEVHEVRELAVDEISRLHHHVESQVQLTLIQKTCSISKYLGRVSQSSCMTSPNDALWYLGSSV